MGVRSRRRTPKVCECFATIKSEAIARIKATLAALTAAQAQALAELADARTPLPPAEDAGVRATIEEGLAQAERGELVEPAKVAALLDAPWK
jgi:hypothetical protein